jgi:acyl carrier protein
MNNIPPSLKQHLDESRAPLPPIAGPDEPLHLDSISFIRLVAFLESDLGIRLEDDELDVDHFGTLRSLDALIGSRKSPTDSGGGPTADSNPPRSIPGSPG